MPATQKKPVTRNLTQAEIDEPPEELWTRVIQEPVGKGTIPIAEIRRAVREVKKEMRDAEKSGIPLKWLKKK